MCFWGRTIRKPLLSIRPGHSRLKRAVYPENTDKPRFAAYPPGGTDCRPYAFQFFATAFHDTAWSFAP